MTFRTDPLALSHLFLCLERTFRCLPRLAVVEHPIWHGSGTVTSCCFYLHGVRLRTFGRARIVCRVRQNAPGLPESTNRRDCVFDTLSHGVVPYSEQLVAPGITVCHPWVSQKG
jgi:hypothetical protein